MTIGFGDLRKGLAVELDGERLELDTSLETPAFLRRPGNYCQTNARP